MDTLSFSPSKLEVFRKFFDEEYNGWFTKEKVIEQIKGEQKTSFAANRGTAIHEIIEHGYEKYFNTETGKYHVTVENRDGSEPDIFIFSAEDLKPVMEYHDTHKRAINEIPLELSLKVGIKNVIMRMRLDQMLGKAVIDHKTSDKEPKLDEFERSVQWKLYLMATGANMFIYNYFQIKEPKRGPNKGRVIITRKEWTFYRYPKMEDDIIGWCNRFMNFCEIEELNDFIKYYEPKGIM